MSAPAKERTFRVRSVTVDVDVAIDEDLLEENGYHHEDDCPGSASDNDDFDDTEDNLRRLSDWHDEAHGLRLWAACPHEPCKLLTDEFRKTP
jgi:hypothetical protein